MLDLIIRGGQVVTTWGVGDWDVAVQGEKIVALAAPNTLTDDVTRVIDATGKIVVPGGIEPHAHIAAPIMGKGNLTTAPPEQVSRAALFGGTTTLLDFAIQYPGIDINQAIQERTSVWRNNSYADYSHHLMLLGEIPAEILGQLHEYIEDGFASVKIFTTNIRPPSMSGQSRMVGMGHLHDLMEQVQRHGAMLMVHSGRRRHGPAHVPKAHRRGADRVVEHAPGPQQRVRGRVISPRIEGIRVDRGPGLLRSRQRHAGSGGHSGVPRQGHAGLR